MLRSLKATNFKRHREIEVDFTETLNVIKGPNGAGKSTLMQAVMFALFGTKAVPGGKAVIPHVGANDAHVELTFDVPAGLATVSRTLKNATVTVDGKPAAGGHEQVTAWVTEQLGMDLRQCRMLAYSEQGETAALFTIGAAALQKSIEEMSGADLIDRVIEKAKTKATLLEGRMGGRQMIDLTPIESECLIAGVLTQEAEVEKDAAVEHLETKKAQKQDADEALNAAQSHNRSRLTLLDKRTRLEIVLSSNESQQREVTEKLKQIPEVSLEEAKTTRDAASTNFRKLSDAFTARAGHQKVIDTINEWLRTKAEPGLAEELRRAPLINDAALALEHAKTRQVTAVANLAHSKDSVAKAEKHLSDAKKGLACATCKRPFEGVDPAHVAGLEGALAAEQAVLSLAQHEKDAAEKAFLEANETYNALAVGHPGTGWADLIRTETAKRDASVQALADLPAANQADLEAAGAAVSKSQTDYDQAVRWDSERKAALARLGTITATLEATRKELAALPEPPAELDLEPLKAARNEAESQVNYAIEALGHANLTLQLRREKVAQLTRQLEDANKNNAIIEEDSKALVRLQRLVKFLRDNRASFLEQTWVSIMANVSEFVNAATSGRISEIRRDDGSFVYVENGHEQPIEAMSGGQRSIAGIALRLALEQAFYGNGGFVILDEPSAELNDEYAASVAGLLAGQGRQIVMVTHRDAEEYSATNVISLEGS